MEFGDSKLNPDAEEFTPTGMVEKLAAMELIYRLVSEAFDVNEEVAEQAFDKLSKVCSSVTFSEAPRYVGMSVVESSVCKSGNAVLGFRIIKRLQNSISETDGHILNSGVFDKTHELSLILINGGFLQKMANSSTRNGPEAGDTPVVNNHQILLVELLHLIVMCIPDVHNTEDGRVALPPLKPCIDLCILADAAFRIQMNLAKGVSSGNTSSQPSQTIPRVNAWHCLLDAFLSKLTQAIPYFNLLLQQSQDYLPTNTWVSTPGTSDRPLNDDSETLETVDVSPSILGSKMDKLLFRVKHMMVIDGGFPSTWLRSTALELLLSSASVYSASVSCMGGPNDWHEIDEPSCSDEDDVSIEGLTAADDPEVLNDFRNFLQSSGQS
ncbi:unnamed protein product [Mesocestoides corti]|uniref:Atx10homo_assoc domain-containing protein n=1 Tax=Mesocestoides corti TaxID=53468 RepID=A0A0R3UJF2_MESCO|nr:unnamed protein product [Mesocestoides corti]